MDCRTHFVRIKITNEIRDTCALPDDQFAILDKKNQLFVFDSKHSILHPPRQLPADLEFTNIICMPHGLILAGSQIKQIAYEINPADLKTEPTKVVLPDCIDFTKAVQFDEQRFLAATRAEHQIIVFNVNNLKDPQFVKLQKETIKSFYVKDRLLVITTGAKSTLVYNQELELDAYFPERSCLRGRMLTSALIKSVEHKEPSTTALKAEDEALPEFTRHAPLADKYHVGYRYGEKEIHLVSPELKSTTIDVGKKIQMMRVSPNGKFLLFDLGDEMIVVAAQPRKILALTSKIPTRRYSLSSPSTVSTAERPPAASAECRF